MLRRGISNDFAFDAFTFQTVWNFLNGMYRGKKICYVAHIGCYWQLR